MSDLTQDIADIINPWIRYIQDMGGVIQVTHLDEETGDYNSDESVEFVFMRKNHAIEELSMTRSDESGIVLTWSTDSRSPTGISISATKTSYEEGFDMSSMDVYEALSEISEVFPTI